LIGGGISLILAIIFEGLPLISWKGLLIVSWLAVINTSLGYLLYNHSLQDLTALEMNMVMNLSPLFTALLGWLILGEVLSPKQLIGMLIVIGGVILVQTTSKSKNTST
jgi:probable blue pigment (indigoidine) exporter